MDHEQSSQPDQALAARSRQEVVNVFPERLIEQILGVIRQRADLVTAFHKLTPEQEAANRVFTAFGAGMAVRDYLPALNVTRNGERDVLLFDVPPAAVSARVWSTAGVMDLKGSQVRNSNGHMPVPPELRQHHIRRVEFYDPKQTLIAIAGAEAPPSQSPQLY